uniref:Uncharacterized protein n=1 Tax=Timema poppense TaxID=170557 RepID=A0A7R9DQC0_TIMPO|nr:unnamed protein product [Timema poppensis]
MKIKPLRWPRGLTRYSRVGLDWLIRGEARSHGVGYYEFSSDETQRRTQQQELSQRRLETKAQQEATHSAKEQRQRQLAARLRAARDRQRARLGLPPQEDEPEQEVQTAEEMVIEPETTPAEIPEPARKVAKVRPWDIGKEGVPERPVLSQEEWVDKKREERPEEFAPPPAYLEDYPGSSSLSYLTRPPPSLFFTSKKLKQQNRPTAQPTSSTSAQTIHNEVEDFEAEKPAEVEGSTKGAKPPRVGVEIAPPPTFEYYGPSSSVSRGARGGVLRREETESSISAGLKYLRQQAEERERKREKGLLDIV